MLSRLEISAMPGVSGVALLGISPRQRREQRQDGDQRGHLLDFFLIRRKVGVAGDSGVTRF